MKAVLSSGELFCFFVSQCILLILFKSMNSGERETDLQSSGLTEAEKIQKAKQEGKRSILVGDRFKRIRAYEFTVAVRPDLSEEHESELMSKLEELIKKNVGDIVKKEVWGIKPLWYRIKKYDRAKFYHFEYESIGVGEKSLRSFLDTNPDFLRYLIVKKEKILTKGHIWRQKVKEQLLR